MTPHPARDGSGWRLESVGGLLVLRSEALGEIDAIAHAFSTRRDDGADDFDLGAADDRSERMTARRSRLVSAAGIDGEAALLHQVHGRVVIEGEIPLDPPPEADAALWSGGRQAPAVRSADCVPILIADRGGRAAVAVHAGWRGTAEGIAGAAVASLRQQGISADDLIAALGPAIGPCCYEVGADVVRALEAKPASPGRPGGGADGAPERSYVDLRGINREQLIRAGLTASAVHVSPWCTRCRTTFSSLTVATERRPVG